MMSALQRESEVNHATRYSLANWPDVFVDRNYAVCLWPNRRQNDLQELVGDQRKFVVGIGDVDFRQTDQSPFVIRIYWPRTA